MTPPNPLGEKEPFESRAHFAFAPCPAPSFPCVPARANRRSSVSSVARALDSRARASSRPRLASRRVGSRPVPPVSPTRARRALARARGRSVAPRVLARRARVRRRARAHLNATHERTIDRRARANRRASTTTTTTTTDDESTTRRGIPRDSTVREGGGSGPCGRGYTRRYESSGWGYTGDKTRRRGDARGVGGGTRGGMSRRGGGTREIRLVDVVETRRGFVRGRRRDS